MSPRDGRIRPPAGRPLTVRGPDDVIVLSGRRCQARGLGEDGLSAVRADGRSLLTRLRTSLPPALTIRQAPHVLERARDHVRERVFVPPDEPGIVIEWQGDPGRTLGETTLTWEVPAARWRTSRSGLTTRAAEGTRRWFCLTPSPEWSVHPGADGNLTIRATVPPDRGEGIRLTALVDAASSRRRPDIRRPLGSVGAQQSRAEADLARAQSEGLDLQVTDALVSDALAWATARLVTTLPQEPSTAPGILAAPGNARSTLIAGLGAIAIGRFDLAALLVGAAPAGFRDILDQWRGTIATRRTSASRWTVEGLLFGHREEPGTGAHPDGRNPSPAEEAAAADRYEAWCSSWRLFHEGAPGAAGARLRELAEHGRRGGWAWTLPDRVFGDPALTALVPATIVFGALGARADASVGRLRLAPRFPSTWSDVSLRGLRLGDSTVSFRLSRGDGHHAFLLEQTSGSVPINLVFEPFFDGTAIVDVRVDGSSAQVDHVSVRGQVGIRLQLPLDRERRIEVRVAD